MMSEPLTGNSVKPYIGFYPMLTDLLADLEAARDHIHLQFFKFEDDPSGRRVADVLMRKARSGIPVRVQCDGLANLTRKRFYRRLEAAGVQVRPYYSWHINRRNHRKNVVIDGAIGYLGGMNIAERYGTGLAWGPWRDTHLRIQGPAVSELQEAFRSDWKHSSGEWLDGTHYFPSLPSYGETRVQIIASGPKDGMQEASLVGLIGKARHYVYLQTPYFIPTKPVMNALRDAAVSGVDVRVMIPQRSDAGRLITLAAQSFLSEAMAAGVKIWFYRKGFLHAKTAVSDDSVTSIGSTNVDARGLTLDYEINACLYDANLARQMKDAFLSDQADSERVDPAQWASRPALVKLKESLARLLSPLM